MDWLSLLPPFFGVLLAFFAERIWKMYEETRERKKFLRSIKKELEDCSDLLKGKGNLLPADMWKSGISAGSLHLLSYEVKNEIAAIYFRIDCHNYEAQKVREVSILAATTKEKPKAKIEVEHRGRLESWETESTHAELLHSELTLRLQTEEESLRHDIEKLLKQNIWDR